MGVIPMNNTPPPDNTLSRAGVAADASAVNSKISEINTQISNLKSDLDMKFFSSGLENDTTLTQLFNKLRYGHGQCGSVYLSESSGLSTNWYWFIYIPHRAGGNLSDNSQYGVLLLINFWSGLFYIARYTNGEINVRNI